MASLKHEINALSTALVKAQTALAQATQPQPQAIFARRAAKLPVRRQTLFASPTHQPLFKRHPTALLGASSTLFKGYPEYNPDQDRDEGGKWTAGGGGVVGVDGRQATLASSDKPDVSKPVGRHTAQQQARDGWNAGNVARTAALVAAGIGIGVVGGRFLLLSRAGAAIPLQYAKIPLNGSTLTVLQGGADATTTAQALKVFDLVPKAHLDYLQKLGVKVAVIDPSKLGIEAGVIAGYHKYQRVLIFSPAALAKPGQKEWVVLHEVGHAIDHQGRFSSRMWNSMGIDLLRSPETKRMLANRGYNSTAIKSEVFAEVYAAKLLQKAGVETSEFHGGASVAGVLGRFPFTSRAIDKLDMGQGRSGLHGLTQWYAEREHLSNIARGKTLSIEDKMRILAGVGRKRASVTKGYPEYNPDQPRDEQGQFASSGGGSTATASAPTNAPASANRRWRNAALGAGGTALGLAAVVALVAYNPAAAARIALGSGRAADRMTSNALNRFVFGGGGLITRSTTSGSVSRSALTNSAFNISTGKSLTPALSKRFGDVDIIVKQPHGSTMAITVRSKGLTDDVINRMHSSGTTGLISDKVYFSAIVDKKVGNVILVESLYAPNTMAGKLFTQKAFITVRDLAVANNADAIVTPAGWAMGGYLWPNAGFQLLGAGAPPLSYALRSAGLWDDIAIRAEALRSVVEIRARDMFRAGALDRASYGKIVAQLDDLNWGPDTPARLSNMNKKVNIDNIRLLEMPHTAAAREIRGDVTIGKALLAHTNGTYVLPKHLYSRMFTITKRADVDKASMPAAPRTPRQRGAQAQRESDLAAPAIARQAASRSRTVAELINKPPKTRQARTATVPAKPKAPTPTKPFTVAVETPKPPAARSTFAAAPATSKPTYRSSYLEKEKL